MLLMQEDLVQTLKDKQKDLQPKAFVSFVTTMCDCMGCFGTCSGDCDGRCKDETGEHADWY